jgi:iron complex outermembrane receptor protein
LFTSARKYISNSVFPVFSDATNYEEESYEIQPKVIVATPLTDRLDNKLTSGFDYIYYMEKRRFNDSPSPEDVVYASEASKSAYLLDEVTMDERWLMNVGARGAWASYVFNQTYQEALKLDRSTTTEGYDGGLGYKYNPDSKVFVDYTHSYRLPVLDEFFQDPFPGQGEQLDPGLTYQTGNQYQLGVKDNSLKDVHLGFTATEVQYKNEIYFNPATFLNQNYNGRTRHFSEEGDVSVDLFNKKVQPFANITFQQARFISGPNEGGQIPDVPDHLANAGITFNPLEGVSTSVTTHFVGKDYLINDLTNTEPKVKRYDTVDWSAKYGFRNIELWVTLQNIFDTRYFNYGTTGGPGDDIYYPAPGRNIEAGMNVKF